MQHLTKLPAAYILIGSNFRVAESIEGLAVLGQLRGWAYRGHCSPRDAGLLSRKVLPTWVAGAIIASARLGLRPVMVCPTVWVEWFMALPEATFRQFQMVHQMGGIEAVDALAESIGRPAHG